MDLQRFVVPTDRAIRLADYPTTPGRTGLTKDAARELLRKGVRKLSEFQSKLYAQNKYALLILFQAIDAAGKDGTIKHVMSGINPAGCQVKSFKVPSEEELEHDYLWRYVRALPERGRIGIFNRSYYEEVLVVRVHPHLLARQRFPGKRHEKFWQTRFDEINHFERYLVNNGTRIVKFFLHLSKDEQKARFMDRLNSPDKNWKFSENDVKERARWNDYRAAFEDMLSHTSTAVAPWHVIPADKKWFSRLAVSNIIADKLASLDLAYPTLDQEQRQALERAKRILENEK